MQRVSSMLPSWDKTKTGSKKGFDKAWALADKLGAPINKLTNKIGSEAFWPTTLDKESDKAARILRSFCKDGFYAEEEVPTAGNGPKAKQRILKKIPERVIQNACGLAIFTTMRTGLWVSGAGGSGVLLARKEDGSWSPPSGILLHTAGLGFLVGVDIYDCVVVINNRKALESFTKLRATVGGEVSAVAGPVGVGGILENDGKWKQANRPVFTYLKSRGFYAGVQIDGTVIIERTDENERFYGSKVGVTDILAGKVFRVPEETRMLMETLKAAEGRTDVDQSLMATLEGQPTPGDAQLDSPETPQTPIFGVPEADDPDPYGVLALEQVGLEIREAGTKSRPSSSQFEYNPSPTSPVYTRFNRMSIDTFSSNNRSSYLSTRSMRLRTSTDMGTQTDMVEMGTQTDENITPPMSASLNNEKNKITEEDEPPTVVEPEEVDYTQIDLTPIKNLAHNKSQDFDGTTMSDSLRGRNDSGEIGSSAVASSAMSKSSYTTNSDEELSDEELEDDEEEEPIVFEVASTQATMLTPHVLKAQGGVVNIPKRQPPPPLPMRSSARSSRVMTDRSTGSSPAKSDFDEIRIPPRSSARSSRVLADHESDVSGYSPMKDEFEDVQLHGTDPHAHKASIATVSSDSDAHDEDHEPAKPRPTGEGKEVTVAVAEAAKAE